MKKPGKASLIIAIGNLLAFGGGYARAAGEAAFHPVFAQGEWWRLLTCGYLHLGAFHLLANLPPLLIAGSKAEDYLGRSRFLFLYHMGTAITAFLFCLSFQNASMVGASLGIYAVLGCCVALHRWNPSLESLRFSKAQKNYLIGYTVLGSLLGVHTIAVHLIGFIIGILFGCVWQNRKPS